MGLALGLVFLQVTNAFGAMELVAPPTVPVPETPIVVARQDLSLDCEEDREAGRLRCDASARYELRNTADHEVQEELTMHVGSPDGLEIRTDVEVGPAALLSQRRLTVRLGPGERVGILVRGVVERGGGLPEEDEIWSFLTALRARHPVVSDRYDYLSYALAIGGARFLDHDVLGTTRIRAPGLDVVDPRGESLERDVDGWFVSRDYGFGGSARRTSTPTPFWNGGPVLGIGGGVDELGVARALGRLGWELGLDRFSVGVLAVETDFVRTVSFAATVGLASPFYAFFVPAFEVRVGGVVDVTPVPQGGLRVVGAIGAWFIGVEGAVDYLPAQGTWRGMVSLRGSL